MAAFKRWFAYRYYRKVTSHRPPMSRREFARLMAGPGDAEGSRRAH